MADHTSRRSLLVLVLVAGVAVTAEAKVYSPADSILVNCGSSVDALDADNRRWIADMNSDWWVNDLGQSSIMAAADQMDPTLPSSVPYSTARVFTVEGAYNFSVNPRDRHWLRLHFFPASFNGIAAEEFHFSLSTSTGLTLLSNFSVYLTTKALTQTYIFREFSLPPTPAGYIIVTFTPTPRGNTTYAYVNGIEVISMPDIFNEPATMVGFADQTVDIAGSTFQTMHRLNAGGTYVPPSNDSGLTRSWFEDTPYVFGSGATQGVTFNAGPHFHIKYPSEIAEYAAPASVYLATRSMGANPRVNQNYNLTWTMVVDANFTYLVRLHFCELVLNRPNQRAFDIYVNNKTAQSDADVIDMTSERGVPLYKDFAVRVADEPGDEAVWVALHPSVSLRSLFYDAILNGLEVFKLNDSSGNLAAPNPEPSKMLAEAELGMGDRKGKSDDRNNMATVMGGTAGGAAVVGIVAAICVVVYQNKKSKELSAGESHTSGWLPLYHSHTSGKSSGHLAANLAGMCRHFSIGEIKAATKNFSEAQLIGVGGFGKVYRAVVDGDTKVAIKRSNPSSEQGVHEFQTEIEMLSKLRHRHLVSLIGFCEDPGEMILVYDYMEHGTLREHLYNRGGRPPLPWRYRLEICIGAARGLHYLHTGAKYTIIHRDVKTTNILVDENWVAKVSDFGLSKSGPSTVNQTHVSTMVKGSFGYLDPEYFRRQQLTDKSDVYSFGIVLFEVLLARPALNPALPRDQVSLADYALSCQRKGTLRDVIDPAIKDQIAPECLVKFAETAEKCLADHGTDRPSMGDVLWNLEFALQLQDTFDGGSGRTVLEPSNSIGSTVSVTTIGTSSTSRAHETCIIVEETDDEAPNGAAFSQLVQPTGR